MWQSRLATHRYSYSYSPTSTSPPILSRMGGLAVDHIYWESWGGAWYLVKERVGDIPLNVPFDPLSICLALDSCHGIKVVDCEQFSVVNKLRGLLLLLLLLNVCSNDRQLTFKGLTTLFHQLERVWGRRTREGRFLSLNVSRRGLSLMHTFWWNEAQKNPPIRGSN